jgi:hypothetical protein
MSFLNTNFYFIKKVELSKFFIWDTSIAGFFLLFNLDKSTILTDKVEISI